MDGGRHQRKWFLLASLLLTLAGAATCGALPVETAAEDAAARPAEGMEFPNTGFIPGDLTEQLNIDEFFSLWFVFLDDDVFTSGNPSSCSNRPLGRLRLTFPLLRLVGRQGVYHPGAEQCRPHETVPRLGGQGPSPPAPPQSHCAGTGYERGGTGQEQVPVDSDHAGRWPASFQAQKR